MAVLTSKSGIGIAFSVVHSIYFSTCKSLIFLVLYQKKFLSQGETPGSTMMQYIYRLFVSCKHNDVNKSIMPDRKRVE